MSSVQRGSVSEFPTPIKCSNCGRAPTDEAEFNALWKLEQDADGLDWPVCPDCAKEELGDA